MKLYIVFLFPVQKTGKNIEDIVAIIDKLPSSRKLIQHPEDQDAFWGEVCKEIGIANSKTRLKNGYLRNKKVIVSYSSHLQKQKNKPKHLNMNNF